MYRDMKKYFVFGLCSLFLVPALTGCWTTIRTVAPVSTPVVVPVKTVYSTTVTTPKPKTTTVTTVTVTSYNDDWSFYLDLNAVAAAFAEARNVQEFEQLLNSSKYMINNLDLNRDGWIDYLRVIETHRGVYHTLLIQACLAPSVYQDVATLVAEHRPNALYVEVVGDRWLYGPNYIVRPVFIKRPPLWDVFGRPQYVAWTSPYYYNYWPSYYQKPKPIYLNHYQAYVNTYMTNHQYCHHCDYVQQPFYSGYTQMTQLYAHNDYASQHPNDSFEQRVTHQLSANGSGVTVRNAGELRTETQRQSASTTTSGVSKRGESSSTSETSSRGSQTTTQSSGTSSRGSQTTTQSSGTSSRGSQTTTQSSGTSSRGSQTTTQSSGTSARGSQTTTPATQTRQPSTSVNTRVKSNGTTRTTIKTTDENGRTQTVQRTSSTRSNNSTSTRSSNTGSRSNTTSTRTSSTSASTESGTRRR